jgi:hypothetical protein
MTDATAKMAPNAADAGQAADHAHGPDGRSRLVRTLGSAAAALLVATLVVAARSVDLLTGIPALIVVGCLLLALPTARTLSGRILVTGLAVLGWNQLLWWWDLPGDRVGLVLAVALGAAAAWFTWRGAVRQTVRGLVPETRAVDLVPVATAALGLVTFAPALLRVNPASALALLLPGWDNSAHFNMFRMILTHGRTVDALPPPTVGDHWIYFDYPQSFHATAATVTQLLWPDAATDAGSSLVAYNRSTALVIVAAVTVIVAGITASRGMRSRWEVAGPIAGLVAGAYFFGPGIESIHSGFASFVLPCTLIGAAIFVVLAMDRIPHPVYVLALGGAVVGVAHGWILLLLLAAPVVVAVLLPLDRERWRGSRQDWWLTALVGVLTTYGVLRAAVIVLRSASGSTLTAPGGILPPVIGVLAALTLGAAGVALMASARSRTNVHGSRGPAQRLLVCAGLIPIAGAMAVYLVRIQVEAHGVVGYYFWKHLTGFELVCVALLAAGVAMLARTTRAPRGSSGPLRLLCATVLLSVATTQVFGYTGPTDQQRGLVSTDPISNHRDVFRAQVAAQESTASQLLSAAHVLEHEQTGSAFLGSPGTLNPINAQQWYLALRGTWTTNGNAESRDLLGAEVDMAATRAVASTWLELHDGVLVVSPDVLPYLEGLDEAGSGSGRVRSW